MASPGEAVAPAAAASGEENAVKKVESVGEDVGELSVNGAPNHSFNSRISTDVVPGDIDMAASQVAVAGSVDSAVEAPVSAGAEPDAVSAGVDTGPTSSSDVVDATEKVESWDLSEADANTVQEGASSKEDSKPNFSEDGTLEDVKTQEDSGVISDLIADAPTSAGSMAVSAGGEPLSIPSADVQDKSIEVKSADAGGLSEVLPSENAANEDVSTTVPDEGSVEKVDSEALEPPMEEVHEVAEATTDVEPVQEVASLEAEPSPSADVEDKSIEVNSEDAGVVSEELPTEVAVSEDVSPKMQDEGSAEKGDSEAPEAPVEEVHEIAKATTEAKPGEEAASLEAEPSPSADVEDKFIEVNSEDAGVVSEELPAEVAVSEDVSPKMQDEGSAEKGDSEAPEAPVEEVHEIAKATTEAEPGEEAASLEAEPSPSADVEDKSIEVNSEDAGVVSEELPAEVAVSEDVSPKMQDEGSAEKGDSEAPEAPVEEVHEVAESTTEAEPGEEAASLEAEPSPSADVEDKSSPETPVEEVHEVAEAPTSAEPGEEVASLEAVPPPSADVEDKSIDVASEDAEVLSEEFPVEVAASEEVSPKVPDEGSAEKGDSAASESPVEEAHEVAEPSEEVASLEAVPPPSADVEDKSVEVKSEDAGVANEELPAEGTASEEVSPRVPDEGSAEKGDSAASESPVEEAHEVAEPSEEVASLEAVPPPSADVEDKSVEVKSEDAGVANEELPAEGTAREEVSPKIPDEGSAEKGDIEAPEPLLEEVHGVAEATTNAEPDEEVASLEAVPPPSVDVEEKSVDVEDKPVDFEDNPVDVEDKPVDVEDKSVEVESEDAGVVSEELPAEVAASEEVSPKIPDEGSAEKGDSAAPEPLVEEVHEVAEAPAGVEPGEEVASLEAEPSPSAEVEARSVEVNSEDVGEMPTILPSDSVGNDGEVPEILAESLDAPVDSEGLDAQVDHVEPTTSVEAHEKSASLESVPEPADDFEDKSVEMDSEDTSEASKVLPSESADKEVISPELPSEESPDNVRSETLYVPDEEVHEVVEATINAEPDEEPVEPESAPAPSDVVDDKSVPFDVVDEKSAPSDVVEEKSAPSDVVEDKSVDVNSEDAIGATPALESVDNEDVSPEPSNEALDAQVDHEVVEPTTSAGADEGSTGLESVSNPTTNVEDKSFEVNPEDTSEAKIESPSESADNEDVSRELPTEGSAENVGSEALFTPVEEVHEVVESTITAEPDEGSASPESGPAPDDAKEKPIEEKSEDLSEATTKVVPLESIDIKDVSRELSSDEVHAPVEDIGKIEDAATNATTDAESSVLESVAASSEDVQNMPETASREFNFDDLKEALTTSDDVPSEKVTPYLATAIGEEGNSSDAVASDTTPLEVSSPPPAVENKETPRSYDLHEVAVNLEDAAEKTLENAKSGSIGDRQASVAESVAQIVLDESGKTGDSSELISGVIQHVAQLAQDDFRSDPNVLPDTVNQVFDREIASSPANEASQPKETTSLGTKFSLFVIWCVSLCASRVSSKDMPAPALKLAAEEVAAVLHSNDQEAASSKAASSV